MKRQWRLREKENKHNHIFLFSPIWRKKLLTRNRFHANIMDVTGSMTRKRVEAIKGHRSLWIFKGRRNYGMGKKLTIQDIARLAGVSKATVSRVLNHHQNVDPGTRELVLRIVKEKGFVPNNAASGLAGGRTRLLGVLIPALNWPLVPEIMRGVGDVIGETSFELIIYSITDQNHGKDRSDVIDRIIDSNLVTGLLAVYPGPTVHRLADLYSKTFPIVLIDDQEEQPPSVIPWIGIDHYAGAYAATRHLISLGHRRIAHIQGPLKYYVSRERFQGYYNALRDAGIAYDAELVKEGDFTPPSGRACTEALLALPDRPTAIFAGSDYMAYGAISAAMRLGLHVPRDIAVVGFDDNPSSAHMEPTLTTVHQPFYEMGRQAIELLLSYVEVAHGVREQVDTQDPLISPALRTRLSAHLIIRSSCGTPALDPLSVKEVS